MLAYTCTQVGRLATNCYTVYDTERDDAIIIDPGEEAERIRESLGGRTLAAIVLTHGHADHFGAMAALRGADVPVYIHGEDASLLTDPVRSYALDVDVSPDQTPPDRLLGADAVTLAGLTFEVLHTPGHTPGSVCLRCGDVIFSGDTLFREGYGRSDLARGSAEQLLQSLRMLLSLPPACVVCPGHGEATTIGEERARYRL